MNGIFITGTDTGVGKTLVSVALAVLLKRKNKNIGLMKPIATGCIIKDKKLISQDAFKFQKITGDKIYLINPVSFKLPLSPYSCSIIEKKTIHLKKIFETYRILSKKYDYLIVEGIGGIMVPIRKKYFVVDLIKKLNLPLILIAKAGLGTLNHTIMTVRIIKEFGGDIKLIFLNNSDNKKDLSIKSNPEILQKIVEIPVFYIKYSKKFSTAPEKLSDYLEKLNIIKNYLINV